MIIHNKSVAGVYESEMEAYAFAKRKYEAGTFLIRKCLGPEEATTLTFHSRVV